MLKLVRARVGLAMGRIRLGPTEWRKSKSLARLSPEDCSSTQAGRLLVKSRPRRARVEHRAASCPIAMPLWSVINTEVLMSKTTRRTLSFDSLEGKVLLSTGLADPAATVARAAARGLSLKGVLTGVASASGGVVSAFTVKGNAASMGKVKGMLLLSIPLRSGRAPNLSDATLILTSRAGVVQVTIGRSSSIIYDYVITAGTGSFASASGSGLITLHFSQQRFNSVILVLHSHPH